MSVDEILADLGAALDLADGQVPLHIIIVAEYLDPKTADGLTHTRIVSQKDDTLAPWTACGMLQWAADEQRDSTTTLADS